MNSPTFITESPLRTARRFADAELARQATATEISWLYDHAFLWLRSLTSARHEIQQHIGKDRKSLARLKPPSGQNPSKEYLDAKNACDKRSMGRMHALQLIERRIEEIKVLVGPDAASAPLLGDLVEVLLSISSLADAGELESAADKAMFWAKRLTRLSKSNNTEEQAA